MRAAVLRQVGDEQVEIVDNAKLEDTGPGMVRVAIHATGVCHSDLSAMTGTIPQPAPCVLGHEGAGEVVEVGPGVTDVAVGDHVIVCWVPPCGKCNFCLTGQANLCIEHHVLGRRAVARTSASTASPCSAWPAPARSPRRCCCPSRRPSRSRTTCPGTSPR